MPPPGFRVIDLTARVVPKSRREAWRKEWEGEASYAWMRVLETGGGGWTDRLRIRVRVLSCVLDALIELKEGVRMVGFANDLRYAARGLARYPVFTLVAVLTLALGIGVNTAVFTLVDGVLIRPLSFHEPDRLVALEHLARAGEDELPISDGLYVLYSDQASSIEGLAMYAPTQMNLLVGAEAERIPIQRVTPSFFDVLGVQPTVGRSFLPEEELPEAEPVVILSDPLWRRAFGGDPSVIGQTVDLNGVLCRIVGVMPPDFGFPDRTATAWIPYAVDPARAPLAAFGAAGIGRIAAGGTLQGLRAELGSMTSRLPELFPESGAATFLVGVGLEPRVTPLKESIVGDVSTTLWILLGTVGFVLLIACANVANLLLVRAETRQRELSLRLALGAGRQEILRYFMGESLILAALGGVLGALVAAWSLGLATAFMPTNLPRIAEVGLDTRVLGFTALLSLGCALFFGLFPLIRYRGDDLTEGLKEGGGRGGTSGRGKHRLRSTLVVLQVAMALVLLVGAGLMFRSYLALRAQDPGYEIENLLTARLSVPPGETGNARETAEFFRQLRDRLLAQAGVDEVGYAQFAPLAGGGAFVTIGVEDHPRGPEDVPVFSTRVWAGQGYFEAMGIQVLEGRTFQSGDGADGTRAVVISENFARHWWPEGSPLGRRVGDGGPSGEDWWEIVGVVANVHQLTLSDVPEEIVYFPTIVGPAADPQALRSMDVVVKTSVDPLQILPVLRRELRELNPRIPLSNARTMERIFANATAQTSFTMTMLGAASGIALLLGLVGIFGVVSYVVSQRTREIGVRMALGATAPSVTGMVLQQGLTLAGIGVVVGLVAAGFLTTLMSTLLFGVRAFDPLTYGSVAVTLVAVAALASWLPARRAAAVDPSRALREE